MKINAVGYARISTIEQSKGESPNLQKKMITERAEKDGLNLIEIYSEAVSGKNIDARFEFQRLMQDAQKGKFQVLMVKDITRLGRSMIDLLNILETLKKLNITLITLTSDTDQNTPTGVLQTQMLSAFSEYERNLFRERVMGSKIALARKGSPNFQGYKPYGRLYDREKKTWSLDLSKANKLKIAADKYLNGISARNIAKEMNTSVNSLLRYFKNAGDKWAINFKDLDKPIEIPIPRILDDSTIQKLNERMAFLKKQNKEFIHKYVLSGYIFCMDCKYALTAQTQISTNGQFLKYYRHNANRNCKPFYVHLEKIEKAVFDTIFQNIYDEVAFTKAIRDSLPDEGYVKKLQTGITDQERQLNIINHQLEKLVELALEGALKKSTIKAKETALLEQRETITNKLEINKMTLSSLPDIDESKRKAEGIRIALMQYFKSADWQQRMSFDDKRKFLNWLFEGKDSQGTKYGIYISKIGQKVQFLIYCKLIYGAKTLLPDGSTTLKINGGFKKIINDFPEIVKDSESGEPEKRKLKRRNLKHNTKNVYHDNHLEIYNMKISGEVK